MYDRKLILKGTNSAILFNKNMNKNNFVTAF